MNLKFGNWAFWFQVTTPERAGIDLVCITIRTLRNALQTRTSRGDGSKCIAGFYGCNTGRDPVGAKASFATEVSALSNFKNVTVLGQLKSAYPSIYSNYRDNQNRESGDFLNISLYHQTSKLDNGLGSYSGILSISPKGSTYMVGGNSAGGFSGRIGLSTPASQTQAYPMRISRNGIGQIGGYQQGARK